MHPYPDCYLAIPGDNVDFLTGADRPKQSIQLALWLGRHFDHEYAVYELCYK